MKAGENSLFPLVHDYLKIYLPKQRNVSPNTIRSYRKALEELLDYAKDCKQISLGEVTFDLLQYRYGERHGSQPCLLSSQS